MSNALKLYVHENDEEKITRLQQLLEPYPEFEIHTLAGKILNMNLIVRQMSEMIISLGIPCNVKGFKYLREAILLTVKKPDIINSITKELYPAIAQSHHTSAARVERAIRHAIDCGAVRGHLNCANNIFKTKLWGDHDKPTNSEFIALIAEKLMLEHLEYTGNVYW
jgi:two-component system response regulator (stage 0 sporulation protein A)